MFPIGYSQLSAITPAVWAVVRSKLSASIAMRPLGSSTQNGLRPGRYPTPGKSKTHRPFYWLALCRW